MITLPNLWFGEVIGWAPNAVSSLVSLVIWFWIRWPLFLADSNKPHQEVNNVVILAKKNLVCSPCIDPEGCNSHFVQLSAFCVYLFKACRSSIEQVCSILSIYMVKQIHDEAALLFRRTADMSEVSSQLPANPISAVGVVGSLSKVPDDYYVVSDDFTHWGPHVLKILVGLLGLN